jgi:transcriptional regulator with XRE-family HTH domain
VDDIRVGRICRELRRRLKWRQSDLAERAGVAQDYVSRLERRMLRGMQYHTLQRVFGAMGARFDGIVAWRGADLDRLLDARSAALVEQAAAVYRDHGWEPIPEVTFQHYADRGSIELFALNVARRAASINEMKTDIPSVEETLRRHDIKVRLAARIVEDRTGWRPAVVGRILVLPEDSRLRRIVAAHPTTFAANYPRASRTYETGFATRPRRWRGSGSCRLRTPKVIRDGSAALGASASSIHGRAPGPYPPKTHRPRKRRHSWALRRVRRTACVHAR